SHRRDHEQAEGSRAMRAYDLVELAGRNLREAVLRNSLTTLGIGVGVASLVAMLSLGLGLQKLFNRQLGRSGLFDSIFVTARRDMRSLHGSQPETPSGPPKVLDDAARKTIDGIPEVFEVYPNLSAVADFRLPNAKADDTHFTVVGGLPPSAQGSESFDDFQGTFFSSSTAPEVILMADFARSLLNLPPEPRNAEQKLKAEQADQLLGKEVIFRYAERQANEPQAQNSASNGSDAGLDDDPASFNVVRREQRLKIVGIVTNEPYRGMRNGRTSALLPVGYAESLNIMQAGDLTGVVRPGQGKTYNALVVRVRKSKDVIRVEDQIKKMGFNTFSIVDASRGLQKAFVFLDLFLGVFGSLALAVASLGIVNTLVMAILERRREIGIMKALGASDADVKSIFFVEAGSMGALGGALGVALGWMIGRVINLGTNWYMVRQDMRPENFWYVPLWLVIAGVIFSVAVSLGAGLYPASRAARLDPVQALRHD
ncbi:MAG TPA: ABC transporter permease, partial [Terriglobales bacterium]|nr:ABC transporter permease [Terriglobales bacterium]